MNYFSKIFGHCKPAAKIDRQEIDDAIVELANVMNELRDAKEELKRTQEKTKESKRVADNIVKKAKAAELSLKRAKAEIARNKEIDEKIKVTRIENQMFWAREAQRHKDEIVDYKKVIDLMKDRVAEQKRYAAAEIKAIHQAIKDAALSRP